MTVRGGWENQFVFMIHTTSISENDAATNGLFVVGNDDQTTFKTGNNGMLVDENASILSGVEHTKVEKSTGIAQPRTGTGFEYSTPKKTPTFSVGSMAMNKYHMALFCWLLFQKGATEAAVTFEKACIPPSAEGGADPEVWCGISRIIGDGTAAIGHSLVGGIIHTLGVSMSQGERVNLSIDGYGRTFKKNYNHTASAVGSTGLADLMFWDFAWTLAGTSLTGLESIDVSINNNCGIKHYQSQVPSSYVLGRFDTTGTFRLAMSNATVGENAQLDNFIEGTDVLLVGTAATPGITISINARYNGDPNLDPAEEMMYDLSFEGAYDGTNQSIEIEVDDGIERGVPA